MTRLPLIIVTLLVSITSFAQEKIPFIDFEIVAAKASEAIKAEDYAQVVDLLNTINKNDSTYVGSLVSKSYYQIRTEDYEGAIKTTNEGLAINSPENNLSFYINKGLAYSNLEDYKKAVEIYDEGLKTYPKYYLLWHNKGIALEGQNNIEGAIEAYEKAMTLNPYYSETHLKLGNICYKQQLFSQALMCFNMYLLFNHNASNAFNTLRSLNNLVAGRNDSQPNPDIQVSSDDEAFEDIDLVLSNKIALNDKYDSGNKINIALTNQNHALLTQLQNFEGNNGFWDTTYVPFYQWIMNDNLFDAFIYTLCSSIENEKYAKIIKQNDNEISAFESLFQKKWTSLIQKTTEVFEGEKRPVVYRYSNNFVEGIGQMKADVPFGKWKFYNANGQHISDGNFNNKGERQGPWTWYHTNGKIKEVATYNNGLLEGENFHYFDNGKPYIEAIFKNDTLNGLYKYYNDKGALVQKKYFKDGELDGMYQSYFKVGEDLPEFDVPYKNGKVEGMAFEYYSDGKVYAEMPFENGKKQGLEKQYFFNSKPSVEATYQQGELNGPYKSYYSNGQVYEEGNSLNDFYNGPWKIYYRNGTLQSDFIYDEGTIDGLYKYYDTDGKPYYEYLYRKGEIIEYRYFDKTGNILSEGRKKGGEFKFEGYYANGNISTEGLYDIKGGKQGHWKFYTENGILASEGDYEDDDINGILTEYYFDGTVKSKAEYKKGDLDGYYVDYYKNGQMKRQGYNKEGTSQGEWRSYYVDGTLEVINFYHKDQFHGTQTYFNETGKKEHTSTYVFGDLHSETYYDHTGAVLETINYRPEAHSYTLEYHYENNKPYLQIDYKNGVMHGNYRAFYFNGKKKIEGQYINGQESGSWTWYYENGNVRRQDNYLYGKLNGEVTTYFENGAVDSKMYYTLGDDTGDWISYYENGTKSVVTPYEANTLQGKRAFYDASGHLQLIRFYDHGRLIGYSYLNEQGEEIPMIPIENETAKIKSFFDNGKVARIMEFKNGALVNNYQAYYYDGQLENNIDFINGEYHGVVTEYYANGNLKTEKTYEMGYLQGKSKAYYENGKIKEDVNYRNNNKNGEAKYFDKAGKLTRKAFYFNDEVYKTEVF